MPGAPAAHGRPVRARGVDAGTGDAAFHAAVAALRSWAPQRAIGFRPHPPGATVAEGATVVLVAALGPVGFLVPVRVVGLVDEPGRFAFAYGTLPGHPERGEQGFAVERLAGGPVRATVRLDAGPGSRPARVLAPAVRLLQAAAVRRYLTAIARAGRAGQAGRAGPGSRGSGAAGADR